MLEGVHGELRTMVEDFFGAFDVLWIEHERPVEIGEGVVLAENTAYLRGRDGVRVQARSAWRSPCGTAGRPR